MEFGDVVFHYSLNSKEQMEGIAEGRDVEDLSRCSPHEVFPIVFSDFTIPESDGRELDWSPVLPVS